MTYQYLCECGRMFEMSRPMSESSEPAACACGKMARRAILSAPGVRGLETGPGNAGVQLHFDRPNPPEEFRHAMQEMDNQGKLNSNERNQAAQIYKTMKTEPYEKLDYQVHGHRIERD